MTLAISTAHRAARNQASITLASGGGASAIRLYDQQGGTLLAVCTLAQPCGVLTPEGRIALQPAAAGQDLVLATGSVGWAEWCDGSGQPIAWGAVTDAAGNGPFKLAGSAGTLIYEGGLALLATPALLG